MAPDEPEGVWGNISLDDVVTRKIEGATQYLVNGNGEMPVTPYYQSLKAMEELVSRVFPGAAEYIRHKFDSAEKKALAHQDSALWQSGEYLFPFLGKAAGFLFAIIGKKDLVSQEYISVNSSESRWVPLTEILSNPRINNKYATSKTYSRLEPQKSV